MGNMAVTPPNNPVDPCEVCGNDYPHVHMDGVDPVMGEHTPTGIRYDAFVDPKYTVGITPMKITAKDKKFGDVIGKFHKQAATGNALLEDKMFYMIINQKPEDMTEKAWFELVRKVLRVEIVQKYPKLIPFGDNL